MRFPAADFVAGSTSRRGPAFVSGTVAPFSLVLALLLGTAADASAQIPQIPLPPEWSNSSEFSFIQTRGNTESTTFGLANELITEWERT